MTPQKVEALSNLFDLFIKGGIGLLIAIGSFQFTELHNEIKTAKETAARSSERIAVVETKYDAIQSSLIRIESSLHALARKDDAR